MIGFVTWSPFTYVVVQKGGQVTKPRDSQCILMYHSVVKVKKIVGLSFSKLSFKVSSVYILLYSSDICLQSIDMLNKNTWDVKKCGANQKQHCKQAGTTKRFDIS